MNLNDELQFFNWLLKDRRQATPPKWKAMLENTLENEEWCWILLSAVGAYWTRSRCEIGPKSTDKAAKSAIKVLSDVESLHLALREISSGLNHAQDQNVREYSTQALCAAVDAKNAIERVSFWLKETERLLPKPSGASSVWDRAVRFDAQKAFLKALVDIAVGADAYLRYSSVGAGSLQNSDP